MSEMRRTKLDLAGKRFGRFTVESKLINRTKHGSVVWRCVCDCGEVRNVPAGNLTSGKSRSCGCLRHEVCTDMATSHGKSFSGEYRAWVAMKERCCNKNARSYKNYGGRGISVCEDWLSSFEKFYEDMGDKPSPKHSIDRIDNNGNYEPENCRWATRVVQGQNTRRRRNNSSGLRGVYWSKKDNKWVSQIRANGKKIYVGASKSLFEIACLRISAENKYWKN